MPAAVGRARRVGASIGFESSLTSLGMALIYLLPRRRAGPQSTSIVTTYGAIPIIPHSGNTKEFPRSGEQTCRGPARAGPRQVVLTCVLRRGRSGRRRV